MSKKLLLADDSVVIQKLVGLSFANEAIEIVSTDNGDDAVSMAREIRPDVVLADVVMPGLSGYEVCEAIKQDPELAGTPVLLLTGTFEAFDDARASTVGANGQITKPFEAQALVERVNEVMAAAAAAAAAPTPQATPRATPPAQATPLAQTTPPVPPKTPPTIEIEAESTSQTSETEETLVTSLGSTPESANLFGDNDGRLSDDTPSDETRLDLTPQLDPAEADFFGAPGEGAAEALDQAGGNLAIGASVEASASADADEVEDTPIAVRPGEGLPPMAPRLTPPSATSAATSDPFERPAVEEKPAEPLPKARPVDLDAALDAVSSEEDPTILVATDDINATTSPNLGEPADEAPTGGFEDLTIHVPSADIDQDRATAPSPDVTEDTGSRSAALRDAAVADLDAALEHEEPGVEDERPALKDFGTPPPRDPFGVAATSEPDATVVQGLDAADPLGLAPASVTGGSVDFAFDVSEQVAAAPPTPDVNEDSFSSLMDISESAILGAGDEPTPTPEIETDAAAETIVAGYDVSSSDLATAPTADEEDTPASEPLPELEPLLEVPELPEAYRPATKETPAPRSIMGDADLFDDLATGSPLDELPRVTAEATDLAFGSGEPLDVDDDLLETDLSSNLDDDLEDADITDITDITDLADVEAPRVAALGEAPEAEDDGDRSLIEAEPAPIEIEEAEQEDDFAIGTPPTPEPDARVADLSPMVEQRIQETLEKVAWEAFSDLSETIVKQVIGRVEQIAWEVIPEMAETLVREEIRKMKGEQD